MLASAAVSSDLANRRAFSETDSPSFAAIVRMIRFQEAPAQYSACSVWSAVRLELLRAPTAFTSAKSTAYASLASAFGPSERNCDALAIRKGFTYATQAKGSLAKSGSSGRHAPGLELAVNLKGPNRPSSIRAEIIAAAAVSPAAIPPSFDTPSGTAVSDASYNGSSAGC